MTADKKKNRPGRRPPAGVVIGVLVAMFAVGIWWLSQNIAGVTRGEPPVPTVNLLPPPPPAPPPPPPPPEKPPEPDKSIEPPKPSDQPKADEPKQLTIAGPAQAGGDSFGIKAGSGGGSTVIGGPGEGGAGGATGGGGFADAAYSRFLGTELQRAVQSNSHLNTHVFNADVAVWVDGAGRLTRAKIYRSSGMPTSINNWSTPSKVYARSAILRRRPCASLNTSSYGAVVDDRVDDIRLRQAPSSKGPSMSTNPLVTLNAAAPSARRDPRRSGRDADGGVRSGAERSDRDRAGCGRHASSIPAPRAHVRGRRGRESRAGNGDGGRRLAGAVTEHGDQPYSLAGEAGGHHPAGRGRPGEAGGGRGHPGPRGRGRRAGIRRDLAAAGARRGARALCASGRPRRDPRRDQARRHGPGAGRRLANKNVIPDWINRIHWSGDFRFRDEFDFYSPNNITGYINYAAFNSNGPTDINPDTNRAGVPFLDTTTNRLDQLSLRARLAMTADIANGVSATIRIASGNDNSPVSTTQLLGGGLTKKDFWLDQAYLKLAPVSWGSAEFGRMPNPFMYTTLVWYDNLNFDGVALQAAHDFGLQGLNFFGTGGAFPIGYSSSTFPTNSAVKEPDNTKWLFALQLGAAYKPNPDGWSVRGAVAYYDYHNIQGELSQPCAIYSGINQCSTDSTAPPFMQKGNTLFLLRQIVPDPSHPLDYAQPQLLGLSFGYQILDVTGLFDMPLFGKEHLVFSGDYAQNLAYDPATVISNPAAFPVNNHDPTSDGSVGPFHTGNKAWLVQATVGNPKPSAPGDWDVTIGYRYIEPDAVLDAFNDHDFHLGGTNAKGYSITAAYFFANNTWVDGRWFSANQVFGPPLAIDVLQLELNTRF